MTYSQKNPIAFNEKPASSVKMNEEFVQIYGALNEIDGLKAPLKSPALTGSPTAPTQTASDNSTKIATTKFVKDQAYFNKANLLGTVSQSGGVPTGAVIERGSNSNGEYVKFADGTMIATKSMTMSGAINVAAGALYACDAESVTLPVSFSFVGGIAAQGGTYNLWGTYASGYVKLFCYTTTAAQMVRITVIGRWF